MRTLLTLLLFVPLIGFSQSSSFVDSRDGKEYKTVKIGEQVWMAENLAHKPKFQNSWIYNNDESSPNLNLNGYLCDWLAANHVCPVGWHLPSENEWMELINYLGGKEKAGNYAKSTVGWDNSGNGNNLSGFNAFPSGFLNTVGVFHNEGKEAIYWASNDLPDFDRKYAMTTSILFSSDYFFCGAMNKISGYSVRCIKD